MAVEESMKHTTDRFIRIFMSRIDLPDRIKLYLE